MRIFSQKEINFAVEVRMRPDYGCRNGGMVDTKDLKSFGLYRLCGFESHFLYKAQRSRHNCGSVFSSLKLIYTIYNQN